MSEIKKEVIFNGLAFHFHPSGFGVYSRNLFNAFFDLGITKKGFFLSKENIPDSVKITRVWRMLSFENGTLSHLLRILWYQLVLPFKCKKNTIFYSPLPEGSIWGRFEQIITIHDLTPLIYPEYHSRLKLYYKWFLPLIIRKSSLIIVPSHSTKSDLIKFFKIDSNKIFTAYNGVNTSSFYKENSKEKSDYYISIGDLRPHKNFKNTIKAFSMTKKPLLYLVGKINTYSKNEAISLIKEYGIEDRVKFLGHVSDQELRKLYNHSKGLLYPSLYEGFGLPIVEALACGCPVLTSNISSMKEIASEITLKADPTNVDDIFQKMKSLDIIDQTMYEYDEYIKDYNWHESAKKILNLLSQRSSTKYIPQENVI